jgi:ABC-type Fe3+-siderophore transport system, permease component
MFLTTDIILFVLNMLFGSVQIPLSDFSDAVFKSKETIYRSIIMDYRLPQAITAVLAGAGLSVSGLLIQTMFRNPLADPSILGISSGSGLGVAFVLMLTGGISKTFWWSTIGVVGSAFIGAALVLLLILSLSSKLKT